MCEGGVGRDGRGRSGATARKVFAVPNMQEAEEHSLDHAVVRSWCPHCVKGRAEGCGHEKRGEEETEEGRRR